MRLKVRMWLKYAMPVLLLALSFLYGFWLRGIAAERGVTAWQTVLLTSESRIVVSCAEMVMARGITHPASSISPPVRSVRCRSMTTTPCGYGRSAAPSRRVHSPCPTAPDSQPRRTQPLTPARWSCRGRRRNWLRSIFDVTTAGGLRRSPARASSLRISTT